MTIKNDALQLAAQPSQIEEAYDSIQKGLSKLTQQLAIIPCSWKNAIFSYVFEAESITSPSAGSAFPSPPLPKLTKAGGIVQVLPNFQRAALE